MKAKGRKRFLLISLLLLLLGGGYAALSFVWHFYPLFANSDSLYRWRYKHFAHLEMHTDRWCYGPGESIKLYASDSESGPLRLSLFDVLGRDTLIGERLVNGIDQPLPDQVSVKGTGWQALDSIKVEADWPSGWYVLRLANDKFVRNCSVFIRPERSAEAKPLAMLLSTNTWNAYNPWGGQSLYSPNYTPTVSFLRPQPLSDPYLPDTYENHQLYFQSARKDRYLAQLIDSLGYDFDVYPVSYLQTHPELLMRYEALTLSTHSEYWTRQMLEGLNAYLDQGGNLLSFSGNTAAYVSYYDPQMQQLTVYKDENYSQWKNTDTTGLRSFGTEYRYQGFHTYAPYEVMADTSFLLDGTSLKKGDLFGERSDTYDYSVLYAGWATAWQRLRSKGRMSAASGMEIDKVYAGTPANFVLLASGRNPLIDGRGEVYPESGVEWTSGTGADLGYYRHPGGGLVFSVGSIAFTGAIPYDPVIRQVIGNLLRHCLTPDRATKD